MIPLVYQVDEAIFSDSNAPSVAEVSFTTTTYYVFLVPNECPNCSMQGHLHQHGNQEVSSPKTDPAQREE